jgi:hypothetical protein
VAIPLMRASETKLPLPAIGEITEDPKSVVARLNAQIAELAPAVKGAAGQPPLNEAAVERLGGLLARVQARDQLMDEAMAGHPCAWYANDDTGYVFTVGRGGAMLFAADLAALPVFADITSDDVKKLAKRVLFFAALIVEILAIIGVILGVKTQPQKAADEIEKALRNPGILDAVEKFFMAIASGAKNVMELMANLIRAFYDADMLGTILSAAFAEVFGVAGIIWLIATLLAKLTGLGAVATAAQLVVQIGGLILKCSSAYDSYKKGEL